MSGDYSSRNRRMLKRFLPYYKKYSGLFALDMFCSAMTTVCEIALPLIVRQITDRAAHDIHDLTAELIIKIVGFYILLRIIDTAASYYTASGGHIMGARIETDMRNDLFSHLQDMSYSFYDDTKIGQLMSRITNDLFDITELAHHGPENVLMTVIKIVAGFIMFASMNIWLAIIVFSLMPLMMLLTSHSRRKMRAAFKQQRREIGEINARTEDSLLGIRVVKSFANEDIEREKFNEGSRRFFKSKKNGYRYMASFHCTVRLCDGLMYIAIVGVGAVFMMKGKTTVGDFSASLLMVSTLLAAIRTMVEFSEQFNRGMTGIERFTEIMDEVSDIKDSPDAKPISGVKGDIEFKNVTFSKKKPKKNTGTTKLSNGRYFTYHIGDSDSWEYDMAYCKRARIKDGKLTIWGSLDKYSSNNKVVSTKKYAKRVLSMSKNCKVCGTGDDNGKTIEEKMPKSEFNRIFDNTRSTINFMITVKNNKVTKILVLS